MTISQPFFHRAHHESWILATTKKIILFLICFSINSSEQQPPVAGKPQSRATIIGTLTVHNQQMKQVHSLKRTMTTKNLASESFKSRTDPIVPDTRKASPRTGIVSPSGYWYADESDDEMSDDFSSIQPIPIVRFITGDQAPSISEVDATDAAPIQYPQNMDRLSMVLPELERQSSRRDVRRAPFSHWRVCLWLFCCRAKPNCY